MNWKLWNGGALALAAAVFVSAGGCNKEADKPSGAAVQSGTPKPDPNPGKAVAEKDKKDKKAEDHSGWWCDEHGLPEEVCDLCSSKYRAAEKKKGNWCEHNRVKTSCFICTPEAKVKYAKEYEDRFGKKPPEPEPEEKGEKGKDDKSK